MKNSADQSLLDARENIQFDGMRMLINGIAHDFSAPLRAVAQLSGMLAEDMDDRMDDEERKLLQLIIENGDKAQTMFAALRKYLDIDPIIDSNQTFPLDTLLSTVLEKKAADIAKLSASVEIAGNLPVIGGNQDYWQIYFECLIENALLFRHHNDDQSPLIKIVVEENDGQLQVCVEDNGIGVGESHWDTISTPFKRLQSDKDYPGLGMGLAYCGRIAQLHGGQMSFAQSSLGGLAVRYTGPCK